MFMLLYKDEIFHVPQAQQYCHGDYYAWDPKLTTPPGLYLVSNVMAWIGGVLGYDLCTVNTLRFTNIVFSIGLYFTLISLVTTLYPATKHNWKTHMYALALTWFPVGFFYNFLYYTDPGSTFLVLQSYLLVKKKRYSLAGLVGMASLTFRQTNVIWLCLFMMVTIIDTLDQVDNSKKNDDASITLYNPVCASIQKPAQAVQSIYSLIINTLKNIKIVLPVIWTFLLGVALFAVFLIWNGGIVLGDRSNHVAGLHFPQLFYYSSFLSFFAAPWTLSLTSVLKLLSIKRHEHPFILSDNRHYTFYVWHKIYRRHWTVRYLLTPVYTISELLNIQAFANHTSFLLVFGYVIVLVLTLVPSPLLEFRYFIIPFLFYMVHIPPPTQTSRTVLGLGLYLAIHLFTVYMFVHRPFVWTNWPDQLQRFMW
ncbi:Dol-P-Glc:Glc(2)Man(9)GlcNAc(2)-PP-Dol alpha-1,2-glucosyltransferase isoform X2 [Mucor ambiguus]|uniref:Dol-P-Glc:Glc(2)Man(9)GlcNAc(2)-PP-Dol alpha-1,2-glucosyltransferase n=1 Tax=Mucor ambiguus TaxID=91626 RepID=A0A0C9M135_9FUNG|nr:Dol-P-Glc:Glc(2)Man(9)GlcNAc(2)-PP-Dol alpha-1,2-glucosyltransferase isoform X2 [Mucor ambiguus]